MVFLLKVIACNNNYIDSKITSTTFWHLASAFYPIEGWYGKHAAIQAPSPWNGNYTVVPELWGHAHTCQFTKIGWKYLDGQGCGYLTGKGSYVTYKSTNSTDYSIVIETKGATANQNIAYNITGGLSTGTVHIWRSNASTQFEKLSDITPVNGSFTMTVEPNSIYTITTTTGQQKGAHPAPPVAQPFPFPYHENYDHYKKTGVLPYYLSDIDGIIEVVNRPDGKGKCAKEVVTKKSSGSNYFSIIGDVNWKDYEVSIDFSIEGAGAAILYGRLNSTRAASIPKSYWLQVNNMGEWGFYMGAAQITSGTVSLTAQPWHNMKLVFQGTTIKGLVNNSQVFSITDAGFSNGMTGLGAGINSTVLFDNLIVNTIDGPKPKPTIFSQNTQTQQ
jgi:galactosylceramidase